MLRHFLRLCFSEFQGLCSNRLNNYAGPDVSNRNGSHFGQHLPAVPVAPAKRNQIRRRTRCPCQLCRSMNIERRRQSLRRQEIEVGRHLLKFIQQPFFRRRHLSLTLEVLAHQYD